MHNVVTFFFSPFPLQLSSALLFDAVYAVVAAVQELNRSQSVGATQLSCKSSNIWAHGTSLMNYLRMVSLPQLDLIKTGTRTDRYLPRCSGKDWFINIAENTTANLRLNISATLSTARVAWLGFLAKTTLFCCSAVYQAISRPARQRNK